MMNRPVRRRQAGMSLIEVLTSVLIFSIGILGLMSLQTRAMQFSTSAEDTNRAALLANEIASQMWTADSVSLTSAVTGAWATRVGQPENGGLPEGQGVVTVTGTVADITITWRAPNSSSVDRNRFVTQVVIAR